MIKKTRVIGIAAAVLLGLDALLYLGGILGQLLENYQTWQRAGGMAGQEEIQLPSVNIVACVQAAFTLSGLKTMGILLLAAAAIAVYFKFSDRFGGSGQDPRGFTVSKEGTYGTASWMGEKELQEVLEMQPLAKADGILLGKRNGKAVCLPADTRLNRHIAVFGASGTGKSRGFIRPALFNIIQRGESAIITDSKGELYADTAELFRQHGYEVQVFNLVNPEHGDSWNCMSDLGGDTLLAQVLTNVIIGNTSSGKTDHFWDNGEGNLLKALILYVDLDPARSPEEKNLPAVYEMLIRHSAAQLTALFERLPLDHPARGPYRLFSQASDTVCSGIVLGLGTRLQVLQNEAVARILRRSDIDLTAPGKRKCATFVVLSDQEATMAFLSSLFFSFLFIKLTRFADSTPDMRCPVPVNLILDEFNNIGKLGGAADGSDFARTLSVVRSRAIYVTLAVQSLGQLQNRYIKALTEAYFFYEIKRFDIKGKEYLRTLGKYYIVDIGLRNYLLGFREGDSGHILENIIFFELMRRGYDVAIGKIDNQEVDFIATKTDEKKYIQVTETMNAPETRERELAPLRKIRDSYEKIVIALECDLTQTQDGIKIIRALDFLLGE